MTIEEKIHQHAESCPNKTALVCDGNSYNYAVLYTAICLKTKTFGNIRGRVIPIVATPTFDFLVSYFAIHLAGAIAVPLDKNMPSFKIQQIHDTFEGKKAPIGTADILYTTGTTGLAKAVMISHEAILANAENLIEAQKFDKELTFIINGPLNHIGSLSKIYPTFYMGGTIQLIDGMKDINGFFTMIDKANTKVATFLVPACIRMLLTFAKDKLSTYAQKIDFIETGAAPIPLEDMQQLCRILPHTRLYNTYASTETGIISTYNYNKECIVGCLGKPMRHSSFFITEDGFVGCKGKTLMMGYFNDKEATEKVLCNGAVVTNDLGYIDDSGRLRLQGRNDDIINVGGYKVDPIEIENVALSFETIEDCVCIVATHPIIGNVLKLLVVTKYDYDRNTLVKFLKSKLEPHKIPVLYEEISEVHRTFNGKIDRKFYR